MNRDDIDVTIALALGTTLVGVGFGMRGDLNVLEGSALVIFGLGMIALAGFRLLRRLRARAPTVSLELSESTVYLVVANRGSLARFWALLRADGMLADMPEHEVFARWDHTEMIEAAIPHRGSHRLRIGRLDAQYEGGTWFVPYTSDNRAAEARAYYSWVAGPSYDDSAGGAAITVTISLFAEPQLRRGPIVRHVQLRGREAAELAGPSENESTAPSTDAKNAPPLLFRRLPSLDRPC